jgi:hypothetical protein
LSQPLQSPAAHCWSKRSESKWGRTLYLRQSLSPAPRIQWVWCVWDRVPWDHRHVAAWNPDNKMPGSSSRSIYMSWPWALTLPIPDGNEGSYPFCSYHSLGTARNPTGLPCGSCTWSCRAAPTYPYTASHSVLPRATLMAVHLSPDGCPSAAFRVIWETMTRHLGCWAGETGC